MKVQKRNNPLPALLFAGALWAYQNRDKVQGWINKYGPQVNNMLQGDRAFTGQTRRFDAPATPPNQQHRTPQDFDTQI